MGSARKLTQSRRLSRFLLSLIDPRAYAQGFRLLNHYNQTHVIPRRSVTFGPNAAISPTSQFSNPDRIHIGARAHIGAGCILWAGPSQGRIHAGDDLLLGPNVLITAANYNFRSGAPVSAQPMVEADVTLGTNVWVGAGAIILPGSQIGSNVVIGAGSVVSGSVKDGQIVAGPKSSSIGQR